MRAIYKIVEVNSPIHGEFRGFRIKLTVDNLAAWNEEAGCHVPSFQAPYLLAESGDYSHPTRERVQEWLRIRMKWMNIDEVECY